MNRIVICDTGPIIHLSEADAIHVLKLAGDILIPPAVATEIQRNLSKGRLPDWIHTRSLNAQNKRQTKIWIQNYLIDPGEAEAIGLAMQEHSDWLLGSCIGPYTKPRASSPHTEWFKTLVLMGFPTRVARVGQSD